MSNTMTACFLDYSSLAPDDLDISALDQFNIRFNYFSSTTPDETLARIKDVDIILSNKVVIDAAMLEACPNIKLIIILATGTNNVDLAAAKALNIPVCNIVSYSTESVVQQTFALLLALQTHLREYNAAVQSEHWAGSGSFSLLDYPFNEIYGKTLGIIGYGAIGRRVKTVAEAFGMQVLVAESLSGQQQAGRVSLPELYRQSDVISIHCPLTPESQGLISAVAFAQMKPSALVLNLGRGGIIDEHDLLAALQQKTIRGCATDVLAQEPPAKNHPLIAKGLDNILITPHIGWGSVEARQQLIDQVVTILNSFTTGSLINPVLPGK